MPPRSVPNKKALVAEICTALSVHAQIEEEIFYPAVKAALKDKLLAQGKTQTQALTRRLRRRSVPYRRKQWQRRSLQPA